MKKILFVALALIVGLASCVKDEKYPGIKITGVSYTPTAVTELNYVTVSAVITSFESFTASLCYVVDGLTYTEEMIPTNEKDTYEAVIPMLPNGTNVVFYVVAVNDKTEAVSAGMEYTVGAVAVDYSVLRLNELNGNDKFIEIYNAGAEAINMAGCYIEKDGVCNWIGVGDVTIEAGGYLLLYSIDVCEAEGMPHYGYPESLIFSSGLSAKKNVRIQLFTPAGQSIDDFNLVNIDMNDPAMIPAPESYGRNADGLWYYAPSTPGEPNIDGANLLLGLEGGDTPEPPTPQPDYTNIVLNELNGDTKFIEIYNMGDLDLPLEGMYICKDGNEGLENAKWVADASVVAPAHGYILLYSEDVLVDHPEQPENLFFSSGLSGKKTIRMALFMADGTERDAFERGTTGEWGQTITNVGEKSFARTPDGGDWKLTEATPNAANPAEGEDIPQE